jgi:hypothetical protein
VVASFRTDDQDANRSGASNLHQFYITTNIIYSVSCEKKPPQNCKDGVNYTSVYRKVNTFLQKQYKKVFFYNKKQRVNLNVIGKFGVTKVVASFRTDDQNANRSSASNLHQFYITTKVGLFLY